MTPIATEMSAVSKSLNSDSYIINKPYPNIIIPTTAKTIERTLYILVFYWCSLSMNFLMSLMVLMNCAGKMMVEFFSTDISDMVWRLRSCKAIG